MRGKRYEEKMVSQEKDVYSEELQICKTGRKSQYVRGNSNSSFKKYLPHYRKPTRFVSFDFISKIVLP